jgi:hypothetical protein
MRLQLRWLVGALAALALACWTPMTLLADQAPFWESPVGLLPGSPDSRVRMAAEHVDVRVVERGDEVRAIVSATFDMVNEGPDVSMIVGFPASTTSLFDQFAAPDAEGRRHADAPVMFSPQALRAFSVSVDGRELRSWRQDVPAAASAGFGPDWLMWELALAAGQQARVDVAYEQVLTDRPNQTVVQPMYVLRTGALWADTIGDAVVTFSAPDGGAFVGGPELFAGVRGDGATITYPRTDQVYGPSVAAESAPTRLVWRFRDVEPTGDVGTTYVRAEAWKRYADAAALASEPGASAAQFRDAAAGALAILSGANPCAGPSGDTCIGGPYQVPRGLVDQLADPARQRAVQARNLAPDDAQTLLTYADLEYWFAMPRHKHHGELGCWPSDAVDAYQRAADLGADRAGARIEDVREAARAVRRLGDARIATCSGQPDQHLDVEMVRATIDEGNWAWMNGVGRGGSAERYPDYFAGQWLAERHAEVDDLRRSGAYRMATLDRSEFTDITIHDANSATAETVEQWQDYTFSADRLPIRDASGTLRQRYELQRLDGQWKIVNAVIVRD